MKLTKIYVTEAYPAKFGQMAQPISRFKAVHVADNHRFTLLIHVSLG